MLTDFGATSGDQLNIDSSTQSGLLPSAHGKVRMPCGAAEGSRLPPLYSLETEFDLALVIGAGLWILWEKLGFWEDRLTAGIPRRSHQELAGPSCGSPAALGKSAFVSYAEVAKSATLRVWRCGMAKLEDLIVDETAFDRDAIADTLLSYVRLGANGELRPGPKWTVLSRLGRVLAVVVAFKAAWALQIRAADGGSATEVTERSGLPGGTVRPKLRVLRDRGLIEQTADGLYRVSSMALDSALRTLRDEEGSDE